MNKSVTHKSSYARQKDDTLDEMNIAAQLASQAANQIALESGGATHIVRGESSIVRADEVRAEDAQEGNALFC